MFSHRMLYVVPMCMLYIMLTTWGCGCGDGPVRDDPISLEILYPKSGEIEVGRVSAKVTDLNFVDKVDFYIDDKKIGSKKAGENKQTFTATQEFDLDAQKDVFVLRIVAFDINGEEIEKKQPVRKLLEAPKVRFLKPTKFNDAHSKIFVGKTFTILAEASDIKGIKEIVLNLLPTSDQKEMLKQCKTEETANKWVRCELQADMSADKYKDGDFVLQADTTSVAGQKPERAASMQITLDKTGPQIAFLSPPDGSNLRGKQLIKIKLRDQVGIDEKQVFIYVNNTKLTPVKQGAEEWSIEHDFNSAGSNVTIRATAVDLLGNPSEQKRAATSGCRTDADCVSEPGTRCCLVNSPVNKDGTKTGQCFPVKTKEGELCDPCTNPCGRGPDGQLMGCLPGACNRPPYQCRRACNLGNPTQRPDKCRAKQGNLPAEYCADSDITKINPQLGSCALGDNCDPFKQTVCAGGAKPPYNGCCPAGFGCFPADDDANICIPEGSKAEGGTNCEWKNCNGGANCKKGLLCTVSVDQQGKPQGPSSCSKMCKCDASCRALGADLFGSTCGGGQICVPVTLTNGRVPLPVGACVRR